MRYGFQVLSNAKCSCYFGPLLLMVGVVLFKTVALGKHGTHHFRAGNGWLALFLIVKSINTTKIPMFLL
jgi:hypothetical protein